MFKKASLLVAVSMMSVLGQAQLVVDGTMTPAELVQNVLLGGGVSISNITFNGGAATNIEQQAGSFMAPMNSNLELVSGVILSTGVVVSDAASFTVGANGVVDDFASNSVFGISDADLEELSGQDISDAAVLEFDFIPTGDSLQFRYVFGSEEYPSFTCSQWNDAFGFFLSGPGIAGQYSNGAVNIALVPGTNIPVSINTLNSGESSGGDETDCAAADPNWQSNSIYFVDNAAQTGTIVTYDGFTTVLTAFALVQCGELYHIKLAIGDGFDDVYDSGVFLEAGSFTSTGQVIPALTTGPGVTGNTMNEGCVPVALNFTRQGDLSMDQTVDIVVSGSATPGVDFSPALPGQLYFAADDSLVQFTLDVPLDPDGPEDVVITINQLVACAGTNVQTTFTFVIDSPAPLEGVAGDVDAACGDVNVLDPQISGGVGYYNYLWSTGETTPTIAVSPAVTTTYELVVTDTCSVEPLDGTFTITLPVYAPLEVEVTPDLQIPCLENDVIAVTSVIGGNGVYSYAWTNAGAVIGNAASVTVPSGAPLWYAVTVSEGCGESVQDSVLVSMTPLDPIQITSSGDITVICRGDSAELSILDIAGGNGVYTVEWMDAQGGALSAAYSIEVEVPVDAAYTIHVEDQCGTVGEEPIRTFIPHYAQFVVSANQDHVICLGDSSVVQVEVQGGSGYYFIDWVDQEWTDPILKVFPAEETTYAVNVIDQCGEILSDEVTVDVESIYIDITVTNRGQDDWYLQAATIPIGRSYLWEMGDGTLYRGDEVVHSYLDLEEHWVQLTMTTDNGCMASDSVLLKAPAHLYFPTAFSPDGDGINETFGPVGHEIEEFEMTVYDRWGGLVYSTNTWDKPWTGEVDGSKVGTTGVYVYKYKATGHYFPSVEGYGHVTLLKGTQD